MKFKIDENLPVEAAEGFRELGHDAGTVIEENLAGAPDTEIVAAAAAEARILVSLDKGIANLVRHPPGTHHGVVLFRPAPSGGARCSNSSAIACRLYLISPWRARSRSSRIAEFALDSAIRSLTNHQSRFRKYANPVAQ